MTTQITISDRERRVLSILVEQYGDDANCLYFRGIISSLKDLPGEKLDESQVRRACRALKRKGLAEYVRGLFDEDGMVAGSGYCATQAGADLIEKLDKADEIAESQQKLL